MGSSIVTAVYDAKRSILLNKAKIAIAKQNNNQMLVTALLQDNRAIRNHILKTYKIILD